MSDRTAETKLTPMTFAEMKQQAAEDLRAVAKLINECADEVAEGDMESFYEFITEGFRNHVEMLVLRQAHRADRRACTDG